MKYLTLLCLLLTACSTATKAFVPGDQAPQALRKKLPSADSPADCKAHHGAWNRVSNPLTFPKGGYCQFKAGDGGKTCKKTKFMSFWKPSKTTTTPTECTPTSS